MTYSKTGATIEAPQTRDFHQKDVHRKLQENPTSTSLVF